MSLQFTNYLGNTLPNQIALKQYSKAKPRPKAEEKSFHKGWKVMGIPPGALEEARAANKRLQDMAAKAGGREIKEFDEAHWLQNHKGKAVRAKPYEIESSASQCAELAAKAGWLRVRIEEVKRVVEKNPGSRAA